MMRQNAEIIDRLFKRLKEVDIVSNHDVSIGSFLRIKALIDLYALLRNNPHYYHDPSSKLD